MTLRFLSHEKKVIYEPPHGKTNNLHRRKQRRRSASRSAKLISAFVFATRIVQFLFYLNTKFQASSSFLCLCRPVCVGPVRNPHCWFSHEAAHISLFLTSNTSFPTCPPLSPHVANAIPLRFPDLRSSTLQRPH